MCACVWTKDKIREDQDTLIPSDSELVIFLSLALWKQFKRKGRISSLSLQKKGGGEDSKRASLVWESLLCYNIVSLLAPFPIIH